MTQKQDNQQEMLLARALRRMLPFYLAFIALVTLAYGLLNTRINANWSIGDWLINYRGGFVRRGFPGEIALDLAHALHLSPVYIVLLWQFFFYSVILYVIWRLTSTIRWNLWLVLLLVSPATLAFHVLDPTAGFRKEILLFAGLGILLLWMLQGVQHIFAVIAYVTALCVVCVLSHEALMIFFPYIVGALWLGFGKLRRVAAVAAIPVLATLLAALIAVSHPGNEQTANAICASIGVPVTTPLSGLCGGAIASLTLSTTIAREIVLGDIQAYGNFTLFSITGLLAYLPVLLAFIALWRWQSGRRKLVGIAAVSVASMAASSVLFYYATDWGRWIYIHLFCISLLLLAVEYQRQREQPREQSAIPGRPKLIAALVFVLAYMLCWDLPHVGLYRARFGYFGLAKYVLNYRSLHPAVHR